MIDMLSQVSRLLSLIAALMRQCVSQILNYGL